jgi:glycosyltransferase involved in cell wall biosynthesis
MSGVPEYLKTLEEILRQADCSGAELSLEAPVAAANVLPTLDATVLSAPVLPTALPTLEPSPPPSCITVEPSVTTGPASVAAAAAKPDRKLKFMLVSTHVQQFTGYAKVSYGILGELAKQPWIQLTHFGFQKQPEVPAGFRPYPESVDVIDAAALEKPAQQGFAYSALPDLIRRKRPNVVMIYNDLSVVARYLEEIRKSNLTRNFQVWVYCDQVYTMQPQALLDVLNRDADRIFAFTPFWKQCLKTQGITRPIDVLTHGFTTTTCYPMPRDLARRQLQLPNDLFLFLNLNRNQPRKRYDILIMAFTELIVKYPTKPLYLLCVCDKGERGGWWLFELFQRELKLRSVSTELFGNRLIVTSQNLSFKDEEVNLFYNAADAGITTADGEGFGLCQFEQMGVGVPQVVPDIGGFKEFCTADNSVLVKPSVRYYLPNGFSPVGGEAHACDPHDVCLAMEEYVLNSEKRAAHGKAAREKVMGYTWAKSCESLLKRLRRVLEDEDD